MSSGFLPLACGAHASGWPVTGAPGSTVAGTVQPAIAGFRLARRLAEGRRANVWLALDARGAPVALKLAAGGSFAREFARADRLAHPHVLRVIEHGHAAGVAYLAMEYAAGGSLAARLGQAVPSAQALRWLAEVASALAQMHRAGLVHRDVKAANLLLRADGTLLLADFGMAVARGHREEGAPRGAVFGTPRSLAPEQAQGAPAAPAADVYGLGVLLHELLCGRPPFDGETPLEVLSQHLVARVPLLPAPHAALQPLLEALLAKDPAQRLPDADAVLTALAASDSLFPHPPALPARDRLRDFE